MEGLMLKYFVLTPRSSNPAFAKASRAAMREYAVMIQIENPALAKDLLAWAADLDTEDENDASGSARESK